MVDTSQDLLNNVQADPQSQEWSRFVRIYTPLIVRWLERFDVAIADRPDLTQEVLLAAASSIESFQHSGRIGAFRTWLRTITLNRCRRHWQAKKRSLTQAQIDSVDQQLDEFADPHSELTAAWDAEHDAFVLQGLFETLAREFDQTAITAFVQVTMQQLPVADVARQLGWPVGRVYKVKYRIMKRLNECAGRYLD